MPALDADSPDAFAWVALSRLTGSVGGPMQGGLLDGHERDERAEREKCSAVCAAVSRSKADPREPDDDASAHQGEQERQRWPLRLRSRLEGCANIGVWRRFEQALHLGLVRDLEIRRAGCHEVCRTVEASRSDADEVGAADMKYALGRRSVRAHAQLEHNGILPAEDNSWADRQNHRIGGSIDRFEGPDKRAIGPQWMFSAHELDRGLLLVRKNNARETTPRRGRSGRQEQSERERSQADNRSAELVGNDSSSMSWGHCDRDSRSTQADHAVTDQDPTERHSRQRNAGEVQPRDERAGPAHPGHEHRQHENTGGHGPQHRQPEQPAR